MNVKIYPTFDLEFEVQACPVCNSTDIRMESLLNKFWLECQSCNYVPVESESPLELVRKWNSQGVK